MTAKPAEQAAPFAVEVWQNPYLPPDADTLDAAVVVQAAEAPVLGAVARAGPGDRAEVLIVDTSGSMGGHKLTEAKAAAATAIDRLEDGVAFALVAGTDVARMIWPAGEPGFAVASADERKSARTAIDRLTAGGMTGIGTWLDLTRTLFNTTPALARHAILLTDGQNTSQGPAELARAVKACQELFDCDCRGVGIDWNVDELRGIANALHGSVRMIAEPHDLADDFRTMITASQARDLPQVRLQVWTMEAATVELLEEAAPRPGTRADEGQLLDLTDRGRRSPADAHTQRYPVGDWAPGEVREYHLRIRTQPQAVDRTRRVAKVSVLLHDGTVATEPAEAVVWAEWTRDRQRYTPIDPLVAALTGQEELRDAIQEAMAAWDSGDTDTATLRLGEAVRLAHAHDRSDTLQLLRKVADICDLEAGTVTLRPDAAKADRMDLDAESVTVRIRPSPDEGDEP